MKLPNLESQRSSAAQTQPAATTENLGRYVPLFCWAILIATVLFITLKIVGYGFIAPGDARRHAAKGITDKPYTEIVVMRPEYTMDHSPGWEKLLNVLHKSMGWSEDALMSFAVVFLLLCIFLAPVRWLRRPEAWLCAVLAEMVALPELMTRFAQTRPLLITEAVLIGILFAWRNPEPKRLPWPRLIITTIGIALSVWMHGAWYLWVLPLLAFCLAQQWLAAVRLAICCAAGALIGASLTGKPFVFLEQAVVILQTIAKENPPQWLLVGEFQPSRGEFETLVLLIIVGATRWLVTRKPLAFVKDPVFWMMALGWVLGFKADRFWSDWGMAGVLVWLTLQFEDLLENLLPTESVKRVALSVFVAVPLFLTTTNDLDRRFTHAFSEAFLDGNDPNLKPWLPEGKGIFYCADMRFFYNTFYKNPNAEWRYILGFEPALMRPDDLATYRRIQVNRGVAQAYEPWVEKMHPEDRLVVESSSRPVMPNLEWYNAGDQLWIGRLTTRK